MSFLIRTTLLLSLVFLLLACVTRKKHDEAIARYATALEMTLDTLDQREVLILRMADSLDYERGGNTYLLQNQQRLEERLVQQAQRIDELQGNVSTTQSSLSAQINRLQNQNAELEEQFQLLQRAYSQAHVQFQALSDSVANYLRSRLEVEFPNAGLRVRIKPGASSLVIQEDLLFRTNSSSRLIEEATPIMDAIAEVMANEPLLKLRIEGHTDNGTNSSRTDNWQFAALRATTLAKKLNEDYYLSANRLIASSYGEYAPLTSNSTAEGRQMNRRIEFVFQNELSNLMRELDRISQDLSNSD